MNKTSVGVVLVSALSLTGCAFFAPAPVQPSDISVEKALGSVGEGLFQFKQQLTQQNMDLGLYVDTINVELDLTTSRDGKGDLSVDFSKGLQLGPKLDMEQSVAASRGSKLTITLKQAMVPAKGAPTTAPGDGKAGKDAAAAAPVPMVPSAKTTFSMPVTVLNGFSVPSYVLGH
ncbi:hypothetical protein [Paraburkholderia dioscoreae]|uniref:Lipoprotein n=1 Tax=Paraburkholderia dioscoreae TaxID=2604047 RepID=A0A5Q4Z743_9BURK|nr:hypothetical protein [Paraburkholderia dioscoreae]VVD29175.1 conserved exported protein of unknown function [Paraburkholderia dioscoreae]